MWISDHFFSPAENFFGLVTGTGPGGWEMLVYVTALFHYYRIPFTLELYERVKLRILILKGWREISAFEQLT